MNTVLDGHSLDYSESAQEIVPESRLVIIHEQHRRHNKALLDQNCRERGYRDFEDYQERNPLSEEEQKRQLRITQIDEEYALQYIGRRERNEKINRLGG